MSTIKVNSIEPANAGSEDYFLARSWVNFNGTGTVAIRADGNVSSLTDNGIALFTVNFSSSFTDANYALCGSCNLDRNDDKTAPLNPYNKNRITTPLTTTAIYIMCSESGFLNADPVWAGASFVR